MAIVPFAARAEMIQELTNQCLLQDSGIGASIEFLGREHTVRIPRPLQAERLIFGRAGGGLLLRPSIIPRFPINRHNLRARQSLLGGTFGRLGVELQQLIILHLDIRIISMLLTKNICMCFNMVDLIYGMFQYREVVDYGFNAMKALRVTRTDSLVTLDQLHNSLTSPFCTNCPKENGSEKGNFGPFIFLWSGERCCYSCLQDSEHFKLVTKKTAADNVQDWFGVSPQKVGLLRSSDYSVPQMTVLKALKGKYLRLKGFANYRRSLVWVEYLEKESIRKQHGTRQNMIDFLAAIDAGIAEVYEWEMDTWCQTLGHDHQDIRHSESGKPVYRHRKKPKDHESYAFQGAIAFPYLDRRKKKVESGLWCWACENYLGRVGTHWRAMAQVPVKVWHCTDANSSIIGRTASGQGLTILATWQTRRKPIQKKGFLNISVNAHEHKIVGRSTCGEIATKTPVISIVSAIRVAVGDSCSCLKGSEPPTCGQEVLVSQAAFMIAIYKIAFNE